jgi:hypothetical protein
MTGCCSEHTALLLLLGLERAARKLQVAAARVVEAA